jgi:hypothetical protein
MQLSLIEDARARSEPILLSDNEFRCRVSTTTIGNSFSIFSFFAPGR